MSLLLAFSISSSDVLLSLLEHVSVELRESGDVIKAENDHKVVVTESEVEGVRKFYGEMFLLSDFRKSGDHGQNFTRSSHGVKDNEEGISHPSEEIRNGFEETESVEGISDDFSDGPSNKKHQNSDAVAGLEMFWDINDNSYIDLTDGTL